MSRFDYIVIGAVSAECAVAERPPPDPSRFALVMKAGGLDSRLVVRAPLAYSSQMGTPPIRVHHRAEPGCTDLRLLPARGKAMERPRS